MFLFSLFFILFQRLFFQLEEAQWFYEDFVRVENPTLPSMKLKTFAERLVQACPIIKVYSSDIVSDLAKFNSYKSVIPVRGAIILNKKMTKTLMVRGWKTQASWGFPRGKIAKDEEDVPCAIREVYEEIGFDITPYIVAEDFVEVTIRQKSFKLFIVRGVPGNTKFQPQTRKEIGRIEWHDVKSLPAYSKSSSKTNNSSEDYFMVAPFMPGLAKYIAKAKGLSSSLTKSETQALRNLLRVEEQTEKIDDDVAAQQLLDLLKSSARLKEEEKEKEVSDRKILLDLLHKNRGLEEEQVDEHQKDLASAKEILSLLRSEINHYDIMRGFNEIPQHPDQFMPMYLPPPPLPPFDMNMPYPPPPPPPPPPPMQFPFLPHQFPMPPFPQPMQQSQFQEQEKLRYSPQVPPSPPNPMLQALVSSRQHKPTRSSSGTNSPKSSGNKLDLFINKKTNEPRKASSALLSLLQPANEKNEEIKPAENVEEDKTTEASINAGISLMHLLKPPEQGELETIIIKEQPKEQSKQQQSLMNLLKNNDGNNERLANEEALNNSVLGLFDDANGFSESKPRSPRSTVEGVSERPVTDNKQSKRTQDLLEMLKAGSGSNSNTLQERTNNDNELVGKLKGESEPQAGISKAKAVETRDSSLDLLGLLKGNSQDIAKEESSSLASSELLSMLKKTDNKNKPEELKSKGVLGKMWGLFQSEKSPKNESNLLLSMIKPQPNDEKESGVEPPSDGSLWDGIVRTSDDGVDASTENFPKNKEQKKLEFLKRFSEGTL